MKHFLFVTSILLFASNLLAQDKSILAQSAYGKAEAAFANGNFQEAQSKLELALSYLDGNTNAQLQYLFTKIYSEQNRWELAESSLESYFKLAPKEHQYYNQMVSLSSDIKGNSALTKTLPEMWEKVKRENTIQGFKRYLDIPWTEANNRKYALKQIEILEIEKELQSGFIVDQRDGEKYSVKKLSDGRYWMMENSRAWDDTFPYLFNDKAKYLKFGKLYDRANPGLCPKGWEIPMAKDILHVIGLDQEDLKGVLDKLNKGESRLFTHYKGYKFENAELEPFFAEAFSASDIRNNEYNSLNWKKKKIKEYNSLENRVSVFVLKGGKTLVLEFDDTAAYISFGLDVELAPSKVVSFGELREYNGLDYRAPCRCVKK